MIVYSIFVIVGVLLLAGAITALKRSLRFLKTAERSVGTVVQVVEKQDDNDGTLYYPVYEFPTSANETVTYRHNTSSSNAMWQVGEKTTFIFEPGNPASARFLSYWGIFSWPLGLLAVAVNLVIIGGGYFLLRGYYGG